MADSPAVRPEAPEQPPAAGTRPAISALDVVALLCELVAFGTLAFWGFATWPMPWSLVIGIGAPVLAILLWALFVSPRAVVRVHPFVRALVELLVYASATLAWWDMGQAWVGVAFAVVAVTAGVLSGRRRLS
ncbi:YrdB family protein [Microbacterium sp. No. 7]|uniref:YrdB family protein n=1 Tax=Microbacterium sp. No. 7 TaxID=1714373 RepID=UPI0006CFE3C8|nr:YrdB family protein [Microbacterium sp. No. 7]ALJ19194.1 4-amino-4-deoxy-L-arabinose transferase [Microbacterium sp. No. 7]